MTPAEPASPSPDAPARPFTQMMAQWSLACLAAAALTFAHLGTFTNIEETFAARADDMTGIAEVRQVILKRWVEEPEEGQLLEGSLRGMMSTLDPFSEFISSKQKEQFEQSTTGKFGGLGIWITVEDGIVVVIAPIEDTPAWKAGIQPGDKILRIDGVATEFPNAPAAVRALKGDVGKPVTLTVLHEGAKRAKRITITRAIITIRSVKGARLLDPETKVGYLRITTFNAGTLEEFEHAIKILNEVGMRGLILDLRGNPGGFLDQAVKIANTFLEDDKAIVKTWSREHQEYRSTVANADQLVTVPTAVLLNRGSASASEVLGGALHDHEKATLIGQRSYGKGSVQTIIPVLAGKAELKLTTQYYFTPKGRRIHRGRKPETDLDWGLIPDIKVDVDPQLRWKLAQTESDQEMARLKSLAKGKPWSGEERLHLDDPQVRAAFTHLLGKLGDPIPETVKQAAKKPPPTKTGLAKQPEKTGEAPPPEKTGEVEMPPRKTGEGESPPRKQD